MLENFGNNGGTYIWRVKCWTGTSRIEMLSVSLMLDAAVATVSYPPWHTCRRNVRCGGGLRLPLWGN